MPDLTVTVRVPMPKQARLGALERAIFTALQAAGRELLVQAFGVLEERVLSGTRQRRRRRYLITRFGELRFHRWQTRTEDGASSTTFWDTLPRTTRARAERPCVPMTTRSGDQVRAF